MREKDLERKLVKAVRDSGGLALKFISPNMNGVPDRLLLFPEGRVAFAEVKAPGEKPRPLQVHRMEQLRSLGFHVYVVDSEEKINQVVTKEAREQAGKGTAEPGDGFARYAEGGTTEPSPPFRVIKEGEASEVSTT